MKPSKEITEGLFDRIKFQLKQQNIELSYIDFRQLTDRQVGSMSRPMANISLDSAKYSRVTMNTVRNAAMIASVFVIVYNLESEAARRQDALSISQDIIDNLADEKLGLPLQNPLEPVTLSNVTDADYNKKGYFIYQINFSFSFNFVKIKENNSGLFDRITNNFDIKNPTGDAATDLQTVNNLTFTYGGTPSTTRWTEPIYGGRPGTIYTTEPICGGNPGSTY